MARETPRWALAVILATCVMLLALSCPDLAMAARAASTAGCDWKMVQTGNCPVDGDVVEIGDTVTDGGDGTGGSDGSSPEAPGTPGDGGTAEPSPYEICAATPGLPSAFCRSLAPLGVANGQPSPAVPGWSVTVSDLARFVPSTATVAGEPDNVAVVGLPANFLSSAKTETVPGTILGRALTIRFTPVSYAFDYGDGEQRTSTTPGTAWDASGQAQFTPTDTSHVYKQPGTYTVTVTVTYAADVDLGTGWIPINGTLNGPPASQQIRVVKAHTALVQGTCLERPSAPGC